MKLLISAMLKFVVGVVLLGTLIFLPAGSFSYTGGWFFAGVLFVPVFVMGILLFAKAPNLLKERLNGKEKEADQKGVVAASGLMFLAGFIVAGLDFRFGWSRMPIGVQITAVLLFLAGYGLYAEVLRENAYLSRTIKVQEGQKVVDSGLYGIVRHPMYMATLLLFMMVPFILGSWWAALPFAAYPVVIARRIKGEEALLCKELEGYTAYTQKVKYKLLPFIW